MDSAIVVTNQFDGVWPFTADFLHGEWKKQGGVEFIRFKSGEEKPLNLVIGDMAKIKRLVSLGYKITPETLKALPALEELAIAGAAITEDAAAFAESNNICVYRHRNEGQWKESVAECAVGLTICGLRRIPQLYLAMRSDLSVWDYTHPSGVGVPGQRGQQYGDDSRFTNGTVSGKRIRIVGAGNIASLYGKIVACMGADVAAYDPYVPDASMALAGVRREFRLEQLVADAEIFAPMVPLTPATTGLITADLIDMLPKGCLVVLVTRANICDMKAVRRRVMNDEIALAADVFDIEPLPFDDGLMNRHNVAHTPHIAGRTRLANENYAAGLMEQFKR